MTFWPVWRILPCDLIFQNEDFFFIFQFVETLVASSRPSDCFPALPSGVSDGNLLPISDPRHATCFATTLLWSIMNPLPSLPALFCLRWGLVGWWTPDLLALRQCPLCLSHSAVVLSPSAFVSVSFCLPARRQLSLRPSASSFVVLAFLYFYTSVFVSFPHQAPLSSSLSESATWC